MEYKISTPFAPRSKPAAKFRFSGGRVYKWNASTKDKNEAKAWLSEAIKGAWEKAKDNQEVHVILKFFMSIPESLSWSEKNLMAWGVVPHLKKPDADNCSKFSLDVASEILWHDDRQLTKVYLEKEYSENPRVEYHIKIKESRMNDTMKIVLGHIGMADMSKMIGEFEQLSAFSVQLHEIENMNLEEKRRFLDKLSTSIARLSGDYGKKLATIAKKLEEKNREEV